MTAKKSKTQRLCQSFITDTLIWTYVLLVGYKVLYQKLIIADRYATFSWNEPLACLGLSLILALVFSFTPMSLGRAFNDLYLEDENANSLKKPYSYFGYLV